MGIIDILNPFRETIFLKTDSSLEKEIEELKRLRNDSNKYAIDNEIKLLELGLQGEKQIEYELKNANIGMYVLHDVTIEHNGAKAQIDWIIVTKAYTYFLECKNLIGNITVGPSGEFRREYTINGKTHKEAIYSPYTQSFRHRDIYEALWKEYHTGILDKTLRRNAINDWIKPMVVLANSKSLLNIKYAPKDIKYHTIRVDNLINYIKKDIANTNSDYYSSKKHMEREALGYLDINKDSILNISKRYKEDVSNDLRSSLEQFRKNKSKSKNVPAYYIFNNEELDKIIKTLPISIEELSEILPEVKVKYHGEEILNIINKNISNK